jgi:hypothetical protein
MTTSSTDRPITHVGFTAEELAAHGEHDHLAAIFPDRQLAEDAVDELRRLGLGSEHLGLAVRGDDQIVFEHDEDADLARDTVIGASVGMSVGAIAGFGLAALAVPGIGLVGLGGILALTGVSALWGGTVGAYLGAAAGEDGWSAHADLGYTALQPGEVFVVVCSHGHADAARDALARHGGRPHEIGPLRAASAG